MEYGPGYEARLQDRGGGGDGSNWSEGWYQKDDSGWQSRSWTAQSDAKKQKGGGKHRSQNPQEVRRAVGSRGCLSRGFGRASPSPPVYTVYMQHVRHFTTFIFVKKLFDVTVGTASS